MRSLTFPRTISIHALREEGDEIAGTLGRYYTISIHALREEGDLDERQRFRIVHAISIHALREEGDQQPAKRPSSMEKFLSTPSARRATRLFYYGKTQKKFLSTPSARRATGIKPGQPPHQQDFYPRPPRGGRQQKQRQNLYFQTNYTTFCTNLEEP